MRTCVDIILSFNERVCIPFYKHKNFMCLVGRLWKGKINRKRLFILEKYHCSHHDGKHYRLKYTVYLASVSQVYKVVCNRDRKTLLQKPTVIIDLTTCKKSFRLTGGITPTRSRLVDFETYLVFRSVETRLPLRSRLTEVRSAHCNQEGPRCRLLEV